MKRQKRRRKAPAVAGSHRPLVVAYVRVSTEGQAEETGLESQRHAIIAYAAANRIEIDLWLQDVDSGAKEHRRGLVELRERAAAGGVSQLLVYRMDRLARDVLLGETLIRELQRAGVRVVSVNEAMLDDSLMGQLMRSILMAFAQYERSVIALRTKAARRLKVSELGSYHGGGVPYGYRPAGTKRDPGHGELVVDEQAAEAVRLAFDLREQGRTMAEIAESLNREGYRTAKGAVFGPTQVMRILRRREVYAGLATTTPSIELQDGVKPRHTPILEDAA